MRVSIVIPAFNEGSTIGEVIARVCGFEFVQEVIVVDDGSTDNTVQTAQGLNNPLVKVVLHATNRGKGAALQSGAAHATGDIVVFQDADLESDPKDIPALLEPIAEGRADVVFGTRFANHTVLDHIRSGHVLSNWCVTRLSNVMTGLDISDMEVGYKVFKREVLRSFHLNSRRFGCEPELAAKVARGRWRLEEVPISYRRRNRSEGKKLSWKDGLAAVWWIVWYRFFE